eukprot:1161669-Pelagomonas_calceolata.AAC.4
MLGCRGFLPPARILLLGTLHTCFSIYHAGRHTHSNKEILKCWAANDLSAARPAALHLAQPPHQKTSPYVCTFALHWQCVSCVSREHQGLCVWKQLKAATMRQLLGSGGSKYEAAAEIRRHL